MAPLRITPRLITVDRAKFELTLWNLTKVKEYRRMLARPITIGQLGHETPTGLYFVDVKNREPDWLAPNSDWVPEDMRGKVIPFEDPHNPFAGGFISLHASEGVGIHGTKFDPAVETAASHGCIRMTVDDLDKVFKNTPVGCPVFIF